MQSKVLKSACRVGMRMAVGAAIGYMTKIGVENLTQLRQLGKEEWLERKRRQLSHAWDERGINWGFGHTGVTVTNFEQALQWYDRVFGMKLMNYLEISGDELKAVERLYHAPGLKLVKLGFLSSKSGNVLEIFEFDPPIQTSQRETWNRPGYTHIAFNVSNVAGWVNRLRREGIEFVSEPVHSAGADWVFFRDPDGNLVELIDLHATRLALGRLGPLIGNVLKYTSLSRYYHS